MTRMSAEQRHRVRFILNGEPVDRMCEPRVLLTDFIRHEIGATGTHVGCEHGVCGACTVEIDGWPARACLTLALQIDGCKVRTVEGLTGKQGRLGVLQSAFRRNHALQCGFCTAGILISLDILLARDPRADEAEIREVLTGHLCRCTGYAPIVKAALEAAAALRGDTNREAIDA
ncbi:(2Fe-2S)-binding protein [Bradyrhizobium jicamae]|uniref:succinate dehydrogenase n=1 Tax=Bradyrhizobium jicamae TaxID=280332 RepID=A0ABS5FKD7_9BRAD|nr:(2Fe-2S)-binding protein [Bradyrhizobium jicamae]MBR0797238.1 (2Fe-2S)-binding protein [Bradyrhizobium jicamae]MBR0938255.1 (2Fe-2S)-binding protein [Bradyrhizobium jicamae]